MTAFELALDTIEHLRADLARVTAERDELQTAAAKLRADLAAAVQAERERCVGMVWKYAYADSIDGVVDAIESGEKPSLDVTVFRRPCDRGRKELDEALAAYDAEEEKATK